MDLVGEGDRAAAWVARRQRGLATLAQLSACGLSRKAVRARVRKGLIVPTFRRVFFIGAGPIDAGARAMAAVLAVEPDAVLSHESAAHELGMLPRPPSLVHVTVVGRNAGQEPGITVHRSRGLLGGEARWGAPLPVTAPTRTLLDLALASESRDLEVALGLAVVKGLVTAAGIDRVLADHPHRPGVARLRALLRREEGPPRIRSEAERRYAALVGEAGLPAPETNAMVVGRELDAYWRDVAVAVEIDSFEFHGSREAFEADRRRDAALKAAGIEVLRFTWRRITQEPLAVVAETAQVLASRQTARR